MKGTAKALRFEWEKLFHDRSRLVFLLLSLALAIGVIILISFMWLGFANNGGFSAAPKTWNVELAAEYTSQRDYFYDQYLIAIGKTESGSVHQDPAYLWKEYRFYCLLLDHKIPSVYSGYSAAFSIFSLYCGYRDYPFLASSRLFFYQDIVFMAIPLFLAANVYFVLMLDKSAGFEKNYRSLGIKPSSLLSGKILFSVLFLLALIVVFSLFGLVFSSEDVMGVYDGGDWHLIPVVGAYFERWAEIFLLMLPFLALDVFITSFSKHEATYFSFTLPVACVLFPSFADIAYGLSTIVSQPEVASFPFWNMITSDGFLDGNTLSRVGYPLLIALGFALSAALVFFFADRRLKFRRKNSFIGNHQ
jgi:hypothetical protein